MGYRGRCWNPGYRRFGAWKWEDGIGRLLNRLLDEHLPETLAWPSMGFESGLLQVETEIDPVVGRYTTVLTVTIMTDPSRVVVVMHPTGVRDTMLERSLLGAIEHHLEMLAGGWRPLHGGVAYAECTIVHR